MTTDAISNALDTLTNEIERLQSESGLAEFLTWQARFYTYSAANALLIRAQKPTASQVAGYHRWLGLGRHVRKGEKGIVILAPIFRRKTDDDADDDDQARQPVTFRAAYVFDVEQTDPLPGHENDVPKRPDIACPVLTGDDGGELFDVLVKVASAEGISVDSADSHHESPSLMGYYLPRERRIWVRPAASLQRAKTLAHELGHHFGLHDESNPNNEAMAEGAAYVVLQAFGLDSGARSVPYIVGWNARQPGAYKSALAGIQKAAKVIIEKATAAADQSATMAIAA